MSLGDRLREEGRAEGETHALRAAIASIFDARSLVLSELGRARIAACVDVATLTRWVKRAAVAASEAEVFAGDDR
jgi:hypothetical protein